MTGNVEALHRMAEVANTDRRRRLLALAVARCERTLTGTKTKGSENG